ncbi:hypothetical protein ERJ75_001690900 [Trypanosoma vivax]|nr:hypothetical protein ERJ75_001690900 [Trypanosoma vivax]
MSRKLAPGLRCLYACPLPRGVPQTHCAPPALADRVLRDRPGRTDRLLRVEPTAPACAPLVLSPGTGPEAGAARVARRSLSSVRALQKKASRCLVAAGREQAQRIRARTPALQHL